MASKRAERLANNEVEFRTANEALPEATREHVRFFCECADRECVEFVHLSPAEYRDVRSDPMQFLVACGHEIGDVETVVAKVEGRFCVVRKDEDVRHVVDG